MIRRLEIRAYPFLIAAYPALALLAANADQVRLAAVVRPLLVSLLLCAVLYALLALLLRHNERAALLTSWWLLLFFAYGHVYNALQKVTVLGESLGRHRYLAVIWLALAVLGAAWIMRRTAWGRTARILNVTSAIAVSLPILEVGLYLVQTSLLSASAPASAALPEVQVLHAPAGQELPDIYYIILDGYGRSDTLEQTYHFDNTEFLAGLRRLGFTVAECSQSNYSQTQLSIASSTNLEYLDALGDSFRPGSDNLLPLRPLIRSSAVRRALKSLGYRTVAFDTGYTFIDLQDADLYLSPRLGNGLAGFELLFIRSTAGRIVLDSAMLLPRLLSPELNHPQDEHRERVLYALDELGLLGSEPGPKYVYAHIVSPHDPFVLGANGEPINAPALPGAVGGDWEVQAYADQARYISGRVLTALEKLIAGSTRPLVILLQGDHGPSWSSQSGRMAILNAYRFPGADQAIRPDISPVNSFRVLFNRLFGTSFSLLPDVSNFSTYPAPFDYTVIPPSCPPQVTP
jgi:hypothetical protein